MKATVPFSAALAVAALLSQMHLVGADSTADDFEYEDFSQEDWAPASSWEAPEEQEDIKDLLADVEEVFGVSRRDALKGLIAENEAGIQPTFKSLAKNEYDKLGHPSVRYLVHRYLVQKHGWFIDGLFAEGEALNSSSPIYSLKDRVPKYVHGLFEKRLVGQGFGLREIAVLVSVVETSIQQEAEDQLKLAYQVRGMPLSTKFTNATGRVMVEKYMTAYILNRNMSEMTNQELNQLWRDIPMYYPTWPRAKQFFNEVRVESTQRLSSVGYTDMARVIERIVNSFGIFMGRQCQELKHQLQGLEGKNSVGCVPLENFYGKGLKDDSNWLFVESPEYLRHIGALDETVPKHPYVLSSNYVTSPNSCLQPSGYYMVCCHNECDDILGQLEKAIGAPYATPKQILYALPAPKDQLLRGGQVPQRMLERLEEVAKYHGEGQVPIHGRLFAQWLHHVYPRECPFPHLSGTKSPQWMEDFESETAKSSVLTGEQMVNFTRDAAAAQNSASAKTSTAISTKGSCAPWQAEEELFAPLEIPHRMSLSELEDDPHVWWFASSLAFVAVVVTMTINALRLYKSLLNLKQEPKMLQV